MTDTDKRTDLQSAYALESRDDSLALYHRWADQYEADMTQGLGYCYPSQVAARFAEMAEIDDGPVVDVGCGTGLVGEALHDHGNWLVDGLDISEAMLAMAARKGCYRRLYAVDLTEALSSSEAPWGGLISAGTYTHGHLGPQTIPPLLEHLRPGALCCIGINAEHYVAMGFDEIFRRLQEQKTITEPELVRVPIYQAAEHVNKDDVALVVRFRMGDGQ
jgi:trans-aconitate methyltransferase